MTSGYLRSAVVEECQSVVAAAGGGVGEGDGQSAGSLVPRDSAMG